MSIEVVPSKADVLGKLYKSLRMKANKPSTLHTLTETLKCKTKMIGNCLQTPVGEVEKEL